MVEDNAVRSRLAAITNIKTQMEGKSEEEYLEWHIKTLEDHLQTLQQQIDDKKEKLRKLQETKSA